MQTLTLLQTLLLVLRRLFLNLLNFYYENQTIKWDIE